MRAFVEDGGWVWMYLRCPRINPDIGAPIAYESEWKMGSRVYHDL